jgi:hypothetical protein
LANPSAPLQQRKSAIKYLVHFEGGCASAASSKEKNRSGGKLCFPYKGKWLVSLLMGWWVDRLEGVSVKIREKI